MFYTGIERFCVSFLSSPLSIFSVKLKSISSMLATLMLLALVLVAGVFVYTYVMHQGVVVNGGAGVSIGSAQITSEPGGRGYLSVTIINTGGVRISSATVSVYSQGNLIYQTSCGPIPAGGSATATGTIPSGISDGAQYMIIVSATSNQGTATASQEVVAV